MSTRTRLLAAGFGGFALVVLLLSLLPHRWHGQLATPSTDAPQYVTYSCGPVLGSGYVHGPAKADYPVAGTPCGNRQELRVIGILDVALGAGAALAVISKLRRETELPGDGIGGVAA